MFKSSLLYYIVCNFPESLMNLRLLLNYVVAFNARSGTSFNNNLLESISFLSS